MRLVGMELRIAVLRTGLDWYYSRTGSIECNRDTCSKLDPHGLSNRLSNHEIADWNEQ